MFRPKYSITADMTKVLMRIDAGRQAMDDLPMTVSVQAGLRESARLRSTHYSTRIEGNRLTLEQAEQVVRGAGHFPGRKRDEQEVTACYEALNEVDRLVAAGEAVTEDQIQRLHAIVMSGRSARGQPSAYRDGQNVIRDSASGAIVYLPPEAADVGGLMTDLVGWLGSDDALGLPAPLRAALVHYQFATIHPYYDGNGRTARLLATLVLHLAGYGLKGVYCLDEYYAEDLPAYYRALDVADGHNYYMNREDADLTGWLEYFCEGMAQAVEHIVAQASAISQAGQADQSASLRRLDARQRKVLALFREYEQIAARQVAELLGLGRRAASALCRKWTQSGFLIVSDPARKTRKYRLADPWESLVSP